VVDNPSTLPPVSTTAVGVAAIRAAEGTRPDALFSDPFADSFLRAAGFSPSPLADAEQQRRVAAVITWVRVRTRFLDDLLLDACGRGCRQVVTLGAGLDARAFRLAWPSGVRCFELDLHEILAFKERVVRDARFEAACERTVVPTDLAGDWAHDLERAGFEATRPTAWVAEGLRVYLDDDTRDAVVSGLTTMSVPGSRF
jgi:methyltransferase (TIGR00027 family)